MKKLSPFNPFIKITIGIAVLIILSILSIRTINNRDAKDKKRNAVVVNESFPIDVSNEPEIKVSQSNSKPTSITLDNKTKIENMNSIDQEDHIFERDESENDSTEMGPIYMADRQFIEIHKPFFQKIGVSQDKIEDIYDFYMEASMEIDNINKYRQFLEDYEMIGDIAKNYNEYVTEVLGETDGEKYEFFTNSLNERILAHGLNKNLDNENQLDDDQVEELTKDFYNIRNKYYDIKSQVGGRFEMTSKWGGNYTREEISAIIRNEYIDSAENILTETQLEMLRKKLN